MFVVLHWGHSRSPKVLILFFVQRQRLSALAGWPWYGADNYSPPCRPDEPHRKSRGKRCQCPLHRHREKPMPAEKAPSVSQTLPSPGPPGCSLWQNKGSRILGVSVLLYLFVSENVGKEALFILFICAITWRMSGPRRVCWGRGGMCTCKHAFWVCGGRKR